MSKIFLSLISLLHRLLLILHRVQPQRILCNPLCFLSASDHCPRCGRPRLLSSVHILPRVLYCPPDHPLLCIMRHLTPVVQASGLRPQPILPPHKGVVAPPQNQHHMHTRANVGFVVPKKQLIPSSYRAALKLRSQLVQCYTR